MLTKVFFLFFFLMCFFLFLFGCSVKVKSKPSNPLYGVLRCPDKEDGCALGGIRFKSFEECETFVENSKRTQPHVSRTCVEL